MGFLDIRGVNKSYGAVDVLHDIDISVEEGEFLVLVGPSGCGKSTLLNCIAGLEEITSGSIAIAGREMKGVHPSRRNIAMVFQSYALYPNMTVAQNITFGLEMHGTPKAEREAALSRVASMLQIEPLLTRKPAALSGGQRQRVAMGRALVRDPDVFLFDEPLSNLDAKLRVDMRSEIKKLHGALGRTIVYVTHDQIEALTLSTRIAVMNKGRVQQLGTPKQIYDDPANLFVATFMGSPSMNLVPATLAEEGGALRADLTDADGAPLHLPLPHAAAARGHVGRAVILGIRPEAIGVREGAAPGTAPLTSRVGVVEPAGADTFVTTELSGADVTARLPAAAEPVPGAPYDFAVDTHRVLIFDPKTEGRIV